MKNKWQAKKKGSGIVHIHPNCDKAIVERNGLGCKPNISFHGKYYVSLKEAKQAAHEYMENEQCTVTTDILL